MAAPVLKKSIGNSASTTGSSGVVNTDTSFPLTSSTNFQAASGEGMVLMDEGTATEELGYSTGLSGGALTIPLANRGLEGGSAQGHDSGYSMKGVLTAGMWNDLIDALTNVLVQSTGAVDTTKVVTPTGTQTLTNKDLSSATNTLPTTVPTKVGIQNGSYVYAADAGSSDAYAITLSPAPSAYAAGQEFRFKANTANTGAATLNVNSLGAKTIKKLNDQDLADNDIEVGQIVTVVYDGTNFQMQSQIANTPASGLSNTTAKARAYRNTSTQSINNASFTKVQLNGETYDPGSNFDNATNYRFVAPTTGIYMIVGNVYYNSPTANKRYAASIYVNGSEVAEGMIQSDNTGGFAVAVSDMISLTTSDYVELYTYHESGASTTITNGSQYTYMSVHLLSV